MSNVLPTTVRQLELAIIAEIESITPTETIEQAEGWKHAVDDRLPDNATGRTRDFEISWAVGPEAELGISGAGGTEHTAEMTVTVHYRTVQEEHLGWLVVEDHWDIFHRLRNRLSPTIKGLTNIESEGTVSEDEDTQIVSHVYTVQYLRSCGD